MGIDPADLDDTQEALLESKGVPIPTARVELTKDLVITDEEESLALTKIAAFNTIIAEVAADFDVPMVDINSWMKPGAPDSPLPGDSCFGFALVSPATTIVSLDGVHANNYGHAFIANEFIRTMNAEFALSIPLLDPESYKGQYLGKSLVAPSLKAFRRLQEMYAPTKR
jgi:hypothetical protein